ncbi:MAG: protein-glutamate O-methyltransferase CheR, partial [Desulfatiglandales bacterium]
MDDQQFRQLLDHFGYSWEGYKRVRKGVKKRISRHMHQLGCTTIEKYLHSLDRDEEVRKYCECLMTVSVSRFFRDRFLWKVLEGQVVPSIIEENRKKVRFWSAGCGCGEEVYSFKILWESLRGRLDPMPELEIWATDMNPVYIKRAHDGIYPLSSLREVPKELRELYFVLDVDEGLYRIALNLKKGILWKVHNLLFDLEEFNFQIIFLRNSILTYYKDELKRSAFRKVMGCLAHGGVLVIGSHEKL